MIDVFTFFAFLAMVLGPALVATFYSVKTKTQSF
jgi:hypothetical protein